MKKFFIILIVSFISISCKKETPVDYVIFSGNIKNQTADYLIIAKNNAVIDSIPVSDNGKFLDTLKINSGSYILFYGEAYLTVYFEPASNLGLSFDAKDISKSLSFFGEGAVVNNYLENKKKKQIEIIGSPEAFYKLDEEAFKAKANKLKNATEQFLEKQNAMSENFIKKEKRNLEYEYTCTLNSYQNSWAQRNDNPDFKVSNDFMPNMKAFDYDNAEDFEFSISYLDLVLEHYQILSDELATQENLDKDMAYLTTVSKISNDTIKNTLAYEAAKYGILSTNDLEGYYKLYNNISTNKKNNEKIIEIYQNLNSVNKGEPSPKFVNYENNDGSKTSLDDFKGKYVYMDVWATWCGPCKQEIPFLKKIEDAYHNKNIVFLSISIDQMSDRDKWKKMISDLNLGGIQILADKDNESQFIKHYAIISIPRFILLDPQGNIVSSDAPRPSDDKLIELFMSLKI